MERILIVGGSGFIGQKLSGHFKRHGFEVNVLSRNNRNTEAGFFHWDPTKNVIDIDALKADIIINLAGAGIADKRWTQSRKNEILNSRKLSTQVLFDHMNRVNLKCNTLINASAIGYYGHTKDIWVDENSNPKSDDFLSDVCRQWEETALRLAGVTRRYVTLRIGTVLDKNEGALPKMMGSMKYGVANYLGNGAQFLSWIHIGDLCRMIQFIIENNKVQGTINAVSPFPLCNRKFTEALRARLNPKALIFPIPSVALKILLGEMSSLVLNSSRVSSKKIMNQGFEFSYPTIKDALDHIYS